MGTLKKVLYILYRVVHILNPFFILRMEGRDGKRIEVNHLEDVILTTEITSYFVRNKKNVDMNINKVMNIWMPRMKRIKIARGERGVSSVSATPLVKLPRK